MTIDFNKLIKKADNEFAFKATQEVDEEIKFIDTGAYALNGLLSGSLYGGIPDTRITTLSGDPSSGKSFLALSMVAAFLQKNPKAHAAIFESEGAIDKTKNSNVMLRQRGIDPARCHILPIDTIQKFKTQALKIINDYLEVPVLDRDPMMFVLDSLGSLSTDKEMEDSASGVGTVDMTGARNNKSTFRTLTLKLNMGRVPLVVCTHNYEQIGTMYPQKIVSGGKGLIYASSIIAFLSKAKAKDTQEEVIGAYITASVNKSRFTRETSKIKLLLNHTTGLDRYYGLVEIGEATEVFKKDGKYLVLPSGEKVYESAIYKNPKKYLDPYLGQLDEACGKLFKYGDLADDIEPLGATE